VSKLFFLHLEIMIRALLSSVPDRDAVLGSGQRGEIRVEVEEACATI